MKKIIFIIIVILTKSAYGQQSSDQTKQLKNIRLAYTKMYAYTDSLFKNTTQLNKCLSGSFSIRFKVDRNGYISYIQTNEGTPGFLDTIFKQVIKQSNKLLKPTTGNKFYIMPIYYQFTANCPVDTNSKKMGPFERLLNKLPTLSDTVKKDGTYTFSNITNFNKTKGKAVSPVSLPIDCYLLTPFNLISPYLEQQYTK